MMAAARGIMRWRRSLLASKRNVWFVSLSCSEIKSLYRDRRYFCAARVLHPPEAGDTVSHMRFAGETTPAKYCPVTCASRTTLRNEDTRGDLLVRSRGLRRITGQSLQRSTDEGMNVRKGYPKFYPTQENPYMPISPEQHSPLLEHFLALLKTGNLEPNEAQKSLMRKLQVLMDEIEAFNLEGGDTFDPLTATVAREDMEVGCGASGGVTKGFWGTLFQFGRRKEADPFGDKRSRFLDETNSLRAIKVHPPIRGLYIWGGVGQGKTMIMDAFYDTLGVKSKTRVHFHQFMLNVHERLHHIKTTQKDVDDPLAEVAKEIRQSCQVLCFDEFQVTHIADAMVLKGLFEALFSFGCIVVATSNRPPVDLYSGGLNRDRFLPFLDLLDECCETFHIDTQKDFRLTKAVGSTFSLYHTPARPIEKILEQLMRLSGCESPGSEEIAVGVTRTLKVPFCADGFAVYGFRELCETTAGVADYLALAKKFHTIFLRDIPCLAAMDERPNEIRRFISLIDVLYERHNRVVFDAEVPFSRLFGTTEVTDMLEKLRQSLVSKFTHLQEFLEEVSRVSGGKQEMTCDSLRLALEKLPGTSARSSEQMFSLLEETFGSPPPIWSIRETLYLHASSYDAVPPTKNHDFLFGGITGSALAVNAGSPAKQLSELAYDQLR